MRATKNRFLYLGAFALAALGGCDVTTVDCDEKPDADICQDDPEDDGGDEWPDDDGGSTSDGGKADAGKSDAGTTDGGKTDASTDGGKTDGGSTDGGSLDGATSDGATSDGAAASPLTIDEFCVAQLKVAVSWRDAFEAACTTATSATRETFLQEVFAYAKDDAEGKCITARKAGVDASNTTFDGSKAQACADAFTKNFEAPPDPFPAAGVDLSMVAANVAHGAPTLFQIPECRAAFKGKLVRGKPCTDHFECAEGLRCLDAPGGGKACETAVTAPGNCTQSSQCADGHTCVGASGSKTCVKSTELPTNGGKCQFSLECAKGFTCNAGLCGNPVANVICKQ